MPGQLVPNRKMVAQFYCSSLVQASSEPYRALSAKPWGEFGSKLLIGVVFCIEEESIWKNLQNSLVYKAQLQQFLVHRFSL